MIKNNLHKIFHYFPYIFFVILAQSLRRTHGALKFNHLIFLTLASILFFYFHKSNYKLKFQIHEKIEKVILFIFLVFLNLKLEIIYAVDNYATLAIKGLLGLSLFINAISFKFNKELFKKLLLICGAVILLLVPLSSPSPRIDVFTILTEASQHLLNGINPYLMTYPDIYNGEYNYEPNLIYWPFPIFLNAISFFAFGDIRFILSLLVIVSSLLIWKKNYIHSLYLLFFPVTIFVIEQAWLESILLPIIILLHNFLKKRKIFLAAVCLGIGCATKQFMIVPAIFSFYFILKNYSKKEAFQYFLISFTIGLGIMLPFLILDANSFLKYTISNILNYNLRLDTLSWNAYLAKFHNIQITSLVNIIIYLVGLMTPFLIFFKKKYLHSDLVATQILVFLVLFLFGKQAFCNYYFLLVPYFLLYFSSLSSRSCN